MQDKYYLRLIMAKKISFLTLITVLALAFGTSSSCSRAKPRLEPKAPAQEPSGQKTESAEASAAVLPSKPLIVSENAALLEDNKEAALQEQEKAAPTGKEDPAGLLEEALSAYQEAQQAWEKGDQDAALRALDQAYSLIARVHLPQDSSLLQEKNDLRLLIAQRIQQIYGSRLVVAGDNHKTIPLVENKYVLQEIQSFQKQERQDFEDAYQRSGLYRDMILDELRKAGMPEELAWLPIIESWFRVRAMSSARALGMWQFISSTGYRFGLKPRDRWVDERMDPIKSTQAAVKYLSELHAMFGDWQTALAAYNCGEMRVQYVIKTQRIDYLDNFWDLYERLPVETARFVPRFIAAVMIINNPEKYSFSLSPPLPLFQFETISIKHPFKLSSLAASLGIEPMELALLNPELRQDSTPDYEYILRIPIGTTEKAMAAISALPRWIPPESTYFMYTVRNGETLSTIAQRFRTSIQAIARLNGLKSVNRISLGQRLKIPGKDPQQASLPPADFKSPKRLDKTKETAVFRPGNNGASPNGDSATRDKTPAGNGNGRDGAMEADGTAIYRVAPGDTLFSISQKFHFPLMDVLSLNGLTEQSTIYPGQEIRVKPKKQSHAAFSK